MRYRTVIFDLDGTLVDSSEGIVRGTEETLGILGWPSMSRDEIRSYIGPPIGRAVSERNGYGKEGTAKFNAVFRDLYKDKYIMDVSVYPGMIDLLSDLSREAFVAVATNKRDDLAKILLDGIGMAGFCNTVQGADFDGTLSKKDLIEKCMDVSKADKGNTVMIGDTVSDSDAAEECGIDFIGVTFGFGFKCGNDVRRGRATNSVRSLRELLFD